MERGNIVEINKHTDCASLLDRIYSSHAFVAELIRKQAQEAGILLRRRYNDYTHTTDFTVLNPIEGQEWAAGDNIQVSLTVKVPACRWHKKGVPLPRHVLQPPSDGR